MEQYIKAQKALDFLNSLEDKSVDLFLIDPPYKLLKNEKWDLQWSNEEEYISWLMQHLDLARKKIKDTGSLVMFHCVGKHNEHPLFKLIFEIEKLWQYRNFITWSKRRGYGKEKDFLFCREEIVWFTANENKDFTFNIPLSNIKRGYKGFNAKYPAKSEFKRITNVWTDIPELMRPKRNCQKPQPLFDRIIQTHSNPDDLVCDFFAGYGGSGISAIQNGRKFLGCEAIEQDAIEANERVIKAFEDEKDKLKTAKAKDELK